MSRDWDENGKKATRSAIWTRLQQRFGKGSYARKAEELVQNIRSAFQHAFVSLVALRHDIQHSGPADLDTIIVEASDDELLDDEGSLPSLQRNLVFFRDQLNVVSVDKSPIDWLTTRNFVLCNELGSSIFVGMTVA